MATKIRFTLTSFLATAKRRTEEAKALLSIPKKSCDGAVACALLAVECALKAVILYGNSASDIEELPNNIQHNCFKGKAGHNLVLLWHSIDPGLSSSAGKAEINALQHLQQLDRYQYRYGAKCPKKEHAQVAVQAAETLTFWTMRIIP